MFYIPALCGLEYHMSLGAIDSHDLCLNTVRARQLYVSYYINLLGATFTLLMCNPLWSRVSRVLFI